MGSQYDSDDQTCRCRDNADATEDGFVRKIQPKKLITHRFALNDVIKAYETFGNASKEKALKVIINNG